MPIKLHTKGRIVAAFQTLPSGKIRAQVRKRGIYRAGTFDTKAQAKQWAVQVEAQINAGKASGAGLLALPKNATLADLIAKYVDTTPAGGKTKTATLNMLARTLGGVKLHQLDAVVMRDWVDKRQAEGAGGVTIGADLSYLSSVLKWAKHVRHLDIDETLPSVARASLSHRKLSTRSAERDREPTGAELDSLYAYWRANLRQRIPMETMCRFALATGMRLSEICRIEWQDIDMAGRTVLIKDRKDPKKKAGNNQRVPLLPDAWAIVEGLEEGTGYIFPFNPASVSTAYTRACAALDIEDLHFHDLRHAAAASFFRMGLDIPQVALLTGHKTWTMLRRYTRVTPSDVLAKLQTVANKY
jgi:integrase